MRSNDQTYISSIGFGDPDKSSTLHDKACKYLTSDEVVEKILMMYSDKVPIRKSRESDKLYKIARKHEIPGPGLLDADNKIIDLIRINKILFYSTSMELPLNQEAKNFKRMVGFIDCRIEAGLDSREFIYIEVKIHPVSINEIMRQIFFYKEYIQHTHKFVLAHKFNMSDDDKKILKLSKIDTIFLGTNFDKWVESQSKISSTNTDIEGI